MNVIEMCETWLPMIIQLDLFELCSATSALVYLVVEAILSEKPQKSSRIILAVKR